MFKNNTTRPENGRAKDAAHNSLVAGVVVKGNLHCSSDLRMDGRLEGDLVGQSKVVLGPSAALQGTLSGHHVVIEGTVDGNIVAQEQLHIKKTGVVRGNITTNKLIIEDGAIFDGASITGQKPDTRRANERTWQKNTNAHQAWWLYQVLRYGDPNGVHYRSVCFCRCEVGRMA